MNQHVLVFGPGLYRPCSPMIKLLLVEIFSEEFILLHLGSELYVLQQLEVV